MTTNVLVCTDNFKGTATAVEVGQAVKVALGLTHPDSANVDVCPLTDGGAGFLLAMTTAIPQLELQTANVVGPLGAMIDAQWALAKDRSLAVVEMAEAAGIEKVPVEQRNPLHTTTFGVGQLIKLAVSSGARKIVIGIGGSATNDGGLGCIQALGVHIYLNGGNSPVPPVPSEALFGKDLSRVSKIELPSHGLVSLFPSLRTIPELQLICDVTNVFVGPTGATAVYGPQKGAIGDIADALEQGMLNVVRVVSTATKNAVDLASLRGSGGAGGLSGMLHVALKAEIVPGGETFAALVSLKERITQADVVVTGEGAYDSQTIEFGKTVAVVKKLFDAVVAESTAADSTRRKKRFVILCGVSKVSPSEGNDIQVVSLVPTFPSTVAMTAAPECIRVAVQRKSEVFVGGSLLAKL